MLVAGTAHIAVAVKIFFEWIEAQRKAFELEMTVLILSLKQNGWTDDRG